MEEAIIHTEIGSLDILTSGIIAHNPVELLGSHMMKELLEKALKSYDVIIIDSNAVLEVTDTNFLLINVMVWYWYSKWENKTEKALRQKKY